MSESRDWIEAFIQAEWDATQAPTTVEVVTGPNDDRSKALIAELGE